MNLSWTPGDGTRGGNLVQPGDKEKDAAATPPKAASVSRDPQPEDDDNPFRPPADLRAEDEGAHKKQKTSAPEKSSTPASTSAVDQKTKEKIAGEVAEAKQKISFSIKGRASAAAAEKAPPATPAKAQLSPEVGKKAPVPVSPLVQNNVAPVPKSSNYVGNTRISDTKKPAVRKEKVRKKRLKPRPELSEEFAQSDSVYFRKTGNESVVGSGTYGKVYKAVHVYSGRLVALKKIRMEGERDGVSAVHRFASALLTTYSSRSQPSARSNSYNPSTTSTSSPCKKLWLRRMTASWSSNTSPTT